MTDDRDASSRAKESLARTTARDVPYAREADSEAEPAPRGQRPAQLPRDLTYEAELARVELAVLRDPVQRDDPSTKPGGGRRARHLVTGQPPESITPESPGARSPGDLARSPDPPDSGGRSVASGTLLSVGAVDPRGKTEPTLETPRMFFSQLEDGTQAYFKPGKIPAVTVHQTLETETVKLSDSIDPRRAQTIPRLDRADLARLAERAGEPDSETGFAASQPPSERERPASVAPWHHQDYEPVSSLGEREHDGQIHASLSPFRDRGEPSFSMNGVATRPEPFVARRASDPPASLSGPEPIATQRDLPHHRIEASQPPPAPVTPPPSVPLQLESNAPPSEAVSPTTASIAAHEPARRPAWLSYGAFAVALLLTTVVGLWLTQSSEPPERLPETMKSTALPPKAVEVVAPLAPAPFANDEDGLKPILPTLPRAVVPAPVATPLRRDSVAAPKPTSDAPVAPPLAAPRKIPPAKAPRETIF